MSKRSKLEPDIESCPWCGQKPRLSSSAFHAGYATCDGPGPGDDWHPVITMPVHHWNRRAERPRAALASKAASGEKAGLTQASDSLTRPSPWQAALAYAAAPSSPSPAVRDGTWSPGVAKAMEVFDRGLAKRRVDELGLPWHVEPWGDGSKPPYVNICSNSHGAVIAADLERFTANWICNMANALVEKPE